ncbi:UNVERIFIED_CONTAM: hypothetical protein GTU68_042384, partial [Idotea baltica]|nr:hypothetical protein [Idotea baltica]
MVRIFMLDEYYGIEPENPLSFETFIREHLLKHLKDFNESNFHIPKWHEDAAKQQALCEEYERLINEAGGLHYQLLGIGRNGHIGFNEPETPLDSRTGVRKLHEVTMLDAASDFIGKENVPPKGVSMGIGTILGAEIIRLVATNEGKRFTVKALVE